jgi:MerR family transcriptional regulator, copper efflux regulator
MPKLRIAQVAEQTGFSPSALRFYDEAGLVTPSRTESGYREYDNRSVETLRFVARAKRFGLSLMEISELVELLQAERCAPVHRQLNALVADKIADAEHRIVELNAFIDDLRVAGTALGAPAPDGPCDDRCGCSMDSVRPGSAPQTRLRR